MLRQTHMKRNNVTISTVFDEGGGETAIVYNDCGWVVVENYLSERSTSIGHDRWCRYAHKYARPHFLAIAGCRE